MVLTETGLEDVDLIRLAKDRDLWLVLVNTAMNFRIPQKAINFLTD